MIYPFIIYLIPGIFRIPSLKNNEREKMYIFSKIIQIIYSSLISSILNIILKQLSLSEKNILLLKENKKFKSIYKRSKILMKFLFYKFILFFIIGFIYLLFFWYYISSFCAVYENTQIHLIKYTLISF